MHDVVQRYTKAFYVCEEIHISSGIYIVHFDLPPAPPPLLRFIFPPTNKFAAGGWKFIL